MMSIIYMKKNRGSEWESELSVVLQLRSVGSKISTMVFLIPRPALYLLFQVASLCFLILNFSLQIYLIFIKHYDRTRFRPPAILPPPPKGEENNFSGHIGIFHPNCF